MNNNEKKERWTERTDRFTSTKEDFVFITEEELKKRGFIPYEEFHKPENQSENDAEHESKTTI